MKPHGGRTFCASRSSDGQGEYGYILRGANRSIIVLITENDDGIRARGRWEPAN